MRIDEAHERVRRGEFVGREDADPRLLLTLVRRSQNQWRRARPLARNLKGIYVTAEVYDYFGEYEACAKLLPDRLADEQRSCLSSASEPLPVLKRRVWVLLACATSAYRKENYIFTRELLDVCRIAVDRLKQPGSLLGTSARLAYAYGQLLRQTHQYQESRREFENAIVFSRQRFVTKTPKGEFPGRKIFSRKDQKEFDRQRLLAAWTIGKTLALGTGYLSYTAGKLQEARALISAGLLLLRETGDSIHRAYSVLLLGAVDRAASSTEEELARAIELLRDGAKGLSEHPAFKARASFELAKALYNVKGHRADAREGLAAALGRPSRTEGATRRRSASRTAKTDASGPLGKSPQLAFSSPRWKINALVVSSRLERLEADDCSNEDAAKRRLHLQQAEADANSACELSSASSDASTATKYTQSENNYLFAEASIAYGEALVARSQFVPEDERPRRLADAVKRFRDALRAATGNPKLEAVAHLHIARTLNTIGDASQAQQHLLLFTRVESAVEHGAVKKLAAHVREEFGQSSFLTFDGSRWRERQMREWKDRLGAFLITQALKAGLSAADIAKWLAVEKSSLKHNRDWRRATQAPRGVDTK